MKKKKLTLNTLKVESFVTHLSPFEKETHKGGTDGYDYETERGACFQSLAQRGNCTPRTADGGADCRIAGAVVYGVRAIGNGLWGFMSGWCSHNRFNCNPYYGGY